MHVIKPENFQPIASCEQKNIAASSIVFFMSNLNQLNCIIGNECTRKSLTTWCAPQLNPARTECFRDFNRNIIFKQGFRSGSVLDTHFCSGSGSASANVLYPRSVSAWNGCGSERLDKQTIIYNWNEKILVIKAMNNNSMRFFTQQWFLWLSVNVAPPPPLPIWWISREYVSLIRIQHFKVSSYRSRSTFCHRRYKNERKIVCIFVLQIAIKTLIKDFLAQVKTLRHSLTWSKLFSTWK